MSKTRLYSQKLTSCRNCPYFFVVDGYSTHKYECKKLNIVSGTTDGTIYQEKWIETELHEWFTYFCPLDEVDNV